ncbi:dihydrofolate reductase family protein [Bacteroides hominis]|uniref:dihydrofolate reductase family protein n=1 Tax=Bacteroides hominis TaxID=2763023 RepID=UPI003D6CBDDC
MGKVVLFAVLTMDGCLTDSSAEAKQWLADADMTDRFGITEMKETAHILDENTPLTLLSDWVKDSPSHSVYFIEANATTAGIINGMMRYRQVDEIILCTIPVIAGNGYRLFLSDLPESKWTCEVKTYKDGSMKAVYRKCDADAAEKHKFYGQNVQKISSCSLPERFLKIIHSALKKYFIFISLHISSL